MRFELALLDQLSDDIGDLVGKAESVARGPAGPGLARVLAGSPEGRALAERLADPHRQLQLSRALAEAPATLSLAQYLAGVPEAIALTQDLAGTTSGRDLAIALNHSESGLSLARALASTPEVLDLTRDLVGTPQGRYLTRMLAETSGHRITAALSSSPEALDLVLNLATTPAGVAASTDVAAHPSGDTLYRVLERIPEGKALATAIETTPAGLLLAKALTGIPDPQGIVQAIRTDPHDRFQQAARLLLVAGSAALAVEVMALVYAAGALARVDDEKTPSDAAVPTNPDQRTNSLDQGEPKIVEQLSLDETTDTNTAIATIESALEPVESLDAEQSGALFADLEPRLHTIQVALQNGRYDSDPYLRDQIHRRLIALDHERQHPDPNGHLDLAVTGALLASLLRLVAPFHNNEPGATITTDVLEALGTEPAADPVPRRILETVCLYGSHPAATARYLGWLPPLDRTSSIITIGTGVTSIIAELHGLNGIPAALVALALIAAAYTWHRTER